MGASKEVFRYSRFYISAVCTDSNARPPSSKDANVNAKIRPSLPTKTPVECQNPELMLVMNNGIYH